jgi:hypothetical protein
MIRLKHTILLVSIAFAGACATAEAPPAPGQAQAQGQEQVAGPPTTTGHHGCPDANPGLKTINIIYNKPGDTITVAPPNAGAIEPVPADDPDFGSDPGPPIHVGDVLRFHLVGADETLVSTSGKEPEDGWLNGSGNFKEENPASIFFYICVPKDLVPYGTDETFHYNVDAFKGATAWPQLDPRVTVRNP